MQALIITIPGDPGPNRPAVSPVTEKDGRAIVYASPAGTFPGIVLQRARQAGARIPDHVTVGEAAGV